MTKPTAKGYIRRWHQKSGRLRMEHDVVWEETFGSIPPGFDVHHKNENKTDNRPENLELLSHVDHKREHSPHYRRNDSEEWERRCRTCLEWKLATPAFWYFHKGWIAIGKCKTCHIAAAVERKRDKRKIA